MVWEPMETAPRDGSWILLEGEFAGGETSTVIIASYRPHTCETGTYEWMTLMAEIPVYIGDDDAQPGPPEWNWYCDGRAGGWTPLPDAPTAPPDAQTEKTTSG